MEILPRTLGTRPRLAVEVRTEGVVAARADDATAVLSAVSQSVLAEGALVAGLKPGNVVDRVRVVAAVREALNHVAGNGRDVTIVVPDNAVRVLLLDFDDLPGKAAEALAVIRFRLKKLLPFDVDTAAVSYQVMSNERGMVRVLAVAMPREVLEEYEGVVSAAGYVPGAVLPSTLAVLAALDEHETSALVINGGRSSLTTAIVRGGVLLLHRALEMGVDETPATDADNVGIEQKRPREYDRIEAEAAIEMHAVLASIEAAVEAREIAQAVSVAAAYFEDTLAASPEKVISAGPLGADALAVVLGENGFEGLKAQELVTADALGPGAAASRVPRSWLAGVRGALKN
jgi:type IV pilus assembly protein PilM